MLLNENKDGHIYNHHNVVEREQGRTHLQTPQGAASVLLLDYEAWTNASELGMVNENEKHGVAEDWGSWRMLSRIR